MKSDGYLEISYRYPDDHDIKKFAVSFPPTVVEFYHKHLVQWYTESEIPSWLGLTIDLGESN